ncbi:S-layer homology domain-containing protein [Fictibacillus arsenicus]|uniref:SLH domain-containing protein n=1 Tax=Fictibacillus arsenicus TaxID=255247 RepID=A0A1V3GC83_9BACL|nr:S-layer homology domain-containing protein [Fictibacillus arsenicus]OOE14427.1 hypothetical protein UN64_04330 [Fictibacillus arsenicus]
MKKFIGGLLGAALLLSPLTTTVNAAEYKDPYDNYFPDDTWGHWAEADMLNMLQSDIVRGEKVENKKQGITYLYLKPDSNITRAEFVVMVVRALELQTTKAGKNFTDIQGHWAQNDINTASALNIVGGRTATTFDPYGKITRAEISAILVRAFDANVDFDKGQTKSFSDLKTTHWAYDDLVKAIRVGVLRGVTETTVSPNSYATRAQSAVMIKRSLGKEELKLPTLEQLKSLILTDEQDAVDATNAKNADELDALNEQNHYGMAHSLWGWNNDILRYAFEDQEDPYNVVQEIASEPTFTVKSLSTHFAEVTVDNLIMNYNVPNPDTNQTETMTEDQSGVYYLVKRDGVWKVYSTDYLAAYLYDEF